MINSIANYLSKSKISAENARRKKQFLSWNKIEKIVLVLDEKNLNKNEIDKLLESTKKYVEVFYVALSAKQASYGDWKCLINKNKTFLGLPNDTTFALLNENKFDLLINACLDHKLFAANFASKAEATFKCGNTNLFGELDLIVERKESQGLIEYLKEVLRYLEMIKTEK